MLTNTESMEIRSKMLRIIAKTDSPQTIRLRVEFADENGVALVEYHPIIESGDAFSLSVETTLPLQVSADTDTE